MLVGEWEALPSLCDPSCGHPVWTFEKKREFPPAQNCHVCQGLLRIEAADSANERLMTL